MQYIFKLRKKKQLNDEYKKFQQQKENERHETIKESELEGDYFASLPVKTHDSAEVSCMFYIFSIKQICYKKFLLLWWMAEIFYILGA